MKITWLGHACFKIQTKNVTLVIDPYDPKIGLKAPNTKADIVLVTHDHFDHNNVSAVSGITGDPYVIKNPGEYEIQEVMIRGIQASHDKKQGAERGFVTMYNIQAEGINLVHVGDLGEVLSNTQIEELGNVDILLIPVGGNYTINAKEAIEVINEVEPHVVIPMHFKVKGLTVDVAPAEEFCHEMGVASPPQQEVYRVVKRDLVDKETELVLLDPIKAT